MDTPFDIDKARKETPGCAFVHHFNNAGASLTPLPVLQAVQNHLIKESEMGGYEASEDAHEKIESTYSAIADLINANGQEIALLENATLAWDMAFYSCKFNAGDRILTSNAEYGSNYLALLQMARKTGAIIDVIPNDEWGQISLPQLRNALDDKVKLIAITHIPTSGGLVNPVAHVGKVAQEVNALYMLDACQSVGQMPIDVKTIGCHILSATGRKYLRGPRGTGFLYVNKEKIPQLEPPFLNLHSADWIAMNDYKIHNDAKRFETWEGNVAAKIGLGEAVRYAQHWGLERIWDRIQALADYLRKQLTTIPGVTVHDQGQVKCGIVTFSVKSLSAIDIKAILRKSKFNVTYRTIEKARLAMEPQHLTDLVRASVHYYNTVEEIDSLCKLISKLAK